MTMRVRPSEPDDLERLIDLTIDTFGPFYEGWFRSLVSDTMYTVQHGTWREDYRQQVSGLSNPDQHRYVADAEEDDAIVGYVAWWVIPARHKGEIMLLAVDSGHRRNHVGTVLCEHAFDHMRGLGVKVVEVSTGGDDFHAPARALYESLGCVKIPTTAYLREL